MDLKDIPGREDAAGRIEEDRFAALTARLLQSGALDAAGLERAGNAAQKTGERIDLVLTRLGLVPEREVAAAWADVLGLPLVESADLAAAAFDLERVNPHFLRKFRVLPLVQEDGTVALAMADPLDDYAARALAYVLDARVERRVAVPGDLDRALRALEARGEPVGGAEVYEDDPGEADIARLRDIASEAPVIRLVNGLIARAVEARASDIHVEPSPGRLRVRFRIDGMLRDVDAPPPGLAPAVASRIKIMAGLDIAERRRPQDGRVRIAVQGRDVDLRVATVPAIHGETIVLRILDRAQVRLDFETLGFPAAALADWRGLLDRPHGILLVTGPTGSGKTTTLYASLQELNTPARKIFTVEDPVEYQLDGITQIQVKPDIGLTFAHTLRSVLRQDPDIIMIGEIRDLETAQIAVQAALTGHLVLATLHTNDAASSITRLIDMGIEDYLIASTVRGVAAQRLVRRLCPQCAEPCVLLPDMTERLGLDPAGGPWQARRAAGCEACQGSGYAGRTALIEVLPVSDAIREQVLKGAGEAAIERSAREDGMRSMFRHGVDLALAGRTTIDEVLRVTLAPA